MEAEIEETEFSRSIANAMERVKLYSLIQRKPED